MEAKALVGRRWNVSALAFNSALPKDLTAGTLYGVLSALVGLSLAALIFSPRELEGTVGLGIRAVLIASSVMTLVVALTSSYFFATSGPDTNYTALLAVSASSIAATMSQRQASVAAVGATVLAMLAASGLVVGGVALLLGVLRIGRLARHLPYTVSGGFLAGSGFLVLAGGFRVATGQALTWPALTALPQVPALSLVTAAAVAVAMLVVRRLTQHFLVLPGIMAGGLALFYGGFRLSDMSVEQARAAGMLLRPVAASTSLLPPVTVLGQVQWDVLQGQVNALLAVAVVVVLGVSLSAANLELTTQRDADFNRELRANGLANILSGLMGGMAGGMNAGRSLVLRGSGANTRLAGVWSSLVCLAVLLFFEPVLFYFPKAVLGGFLVGIGGGYLRDWLWTTYTKLPKAEYALIWAILILIVVVGLVPGVVLGLIVAGMLFIYRYGHTEVIRSSVSSDVHSSNKERSAGEMAQLKKSGKLARIITLQGYIFFGTSTVVLDACRQLIEVDGVSYLVLDFRLVQGIDVSAVATLTRLAQTCARAKAKLVLTELRPEVLDLLKKSRFVPHPAIELIAERNRAMEWVEDRLIEPIQAGLRDALAPQFGAESLNVLLQYFDAINLERGAALFRQGDPGNELYFIENGELSAQLCLENGENLRLRKSGPGTIVGEMALYTHESRSADVVSETPSQVLKLTAHNLRRLEQEHPQLAIQFHSFLVKTLSSRLASSTEEVRTLA